MDAARWVYAMKELEPINIGLDKDQRAKVIDLLQVMLANQHVLYIKLRNYHWNLHGPRFSPLHSLFEEHYGLLEASIDETAERIRMLGGIPAGSMAQFTERSTLSEADGELIDGQDAIKALVEDREAIIRGGRKAIDKISGLGDEGTADMLVAQLRSHEKIAWMLRSFL